MAAFVHPNSTEFHFQLFSGIQLMSLFPEMPLHRRPTDIDEQLHAHGDS